MGRLARGVAVVAVCAGVAAVPVAGPPAVAAPGDLAPVMVILDASGSMLASAGGGVDKMTAAKRAVGTLVRQAPEGAQLGLTVYGTGTGNSAAEKAAGCRDVRVVRPVAPLDRTGFLAAVNGVRARGYTPIGRALRAAAQALPAEGPRSIVLVSDGIDSCAPPDPCQVARELAKQGLDLRIHAIGFNVDGAAQRQLTCVAQATGGTYEDAPDAAALGRALNRTAQRALRSYEPAGTPVTGTPQQRGAPPLVPGAYLDQIARDQVRYYAIDVPAGFTLHATAIVIDTAQRSGGLLRVTRYAADGTECDWAEKIKERDAPMTSAVLTWAAPGSERTSPRPCQKVGPMGLRVSLRGGADVGSRSLELLIGLEPPVDGNPGPQPGGPVAFGAPGGPPRPVVGGGSFGSAATLDGSGSYTDTVVPGEFLFYRVRLDWGQGMAYRVRFPAQPGGGSRILRTSWYGSTRAEMGLSQQAYSGQEMALPQNAPAVATWQIRYLNRNKVSDGGRPQSLAGWYYLAVWNRGQPQTAPVPMTIDLTVTGEREPGPPYVGTGRDTFGNAVEPTASPIPSPSVGSTASDVITERPAASTASGVGPLVWLVPLAAVVGGGLAAWVVIRRRRRSSNISSPMD